MRKAKKLYLSIGSVLVAVAALVMLNVTGTTTKAETRDCEADTIIQCGALTQSELIQKYDQDSTGDIQAVYSHYGIARSDLTGATSQIKTGTVYRDGRVVVDGQTVATGAFSVSRIRFSSASRAVTIAGKTFYEGPDMSIFVRDVQAYVMFRNGQFYRAVLISCGNPLMATPVTPPAPKPQPAYSCDSLTAVKVDRTNFKFTAAATAKNGAEITSYTYNFGDGGNVTVNNTTVPHTYSKPGTYTATVTANVISNGVPKSASGPNCTVTVTVAPVPVTPSSVCNSLQAEQIDRTTFKFTTSASAEGGAKIVNYTYDFGDNSTQTVSGTSVTHSYAKPGTYNVTVSVNVNMNGTNKVITGENCQTTVEVKPVPIVPQYACTDLTVDKIDRTTFKFTTNASAESGAKIVSYTYDFGDSNSETVNSASITHTYSQPGTYTAQVSVNVLANGENQVATSENCMASVTVEEVPVTPPITPTTPPVTPSVIPEQLPVTGIGSLLGGGLGFTSISAAAYYWLASRKSLLNALMNR